MNFTDIPKPPALIELMLIKLNWNTDDDQQKYNSEMTL